MAMSLTARPCISATRTARVGAKNVKPARIAPVTKATAAGEVPDMDKRNTMNLLLLGGISLPVGAMGLPYLAFFVPNTGGAGSVGIVGKDKLGNDVKVSQWTKTHGPNDRSLIQGLKGDPSYLIVKEDQTVENYALNAVCTHLGCVVPWQSAENKFKCPCHGSQYNAQGKVIRGPAPLSLALQHVDTQDDTVIISPWTETDFRDGSAPWWA